MSFEFSAKNKDLGFKKAVFPISVVAEVLSMHQRTLRIYDDLKILSPTRTNNRRKYSLNDIEKGKFINYLTKELGINLNGVKLILSLLGSEFSDYSEQRAYVQKIACDMNLIQKI